MDFFLKGTVVGIISKSKKGSVIYIIEKFGQLEFHLFQCPNYALYMQRTAAKSMGFTSCTNAQKWYSKVRNVYMTLWACV